MSFEVSNIWFSDSITKYKKVTTFSDSTPGYSYTLKRRFHYWNITWSIDFMV